jgi:hypothetical protein
MTVERFEGRPGQHAISSGWYRIDRYRLSLSGVEQHLFCRIDEEAEWRRALRTAREVDAVTGNGGRERLEYALQLPAGELVDRSLLAARTRFPHRRDPLAR